LPVTIRRWRPAPKPAGSPSSSMLPLLPIGPSRPSRPW